MTTDLTRWLLRLTRPILAPLALSITMRIAGLLSGAALLGVAASAVTSAADGDVAVRSTVTALVVIALVKALTRYLEQYAGHYVAFKALAMIRVHLFARLEPQAPAAIEGRRTGDLLSRATRDVDRIEVFFAHTLGPAVTAVLVPAAVVVWLAAHTGAAAALTAAGGWLIMASVAALGAKGSVSAAAAIRQSRGEIAQHVTDSVQGNREVLAFGAQDARLARLDELGAETGRYQATRARWSAVRRGAVTGITAALPIAVLALASAGAGWQSAVVAAAVVLGTTPAVAAIEEFAAELDQAYASAARVREIADAPPATPEPVHPAAAPQGGALGVLLDGVTFAYPSLSGSPSRPALTDVTVAVEAGTTVALVGASGAGKSTVGALIARFHDPDQGAVHVGGIDVRTLADADLRALVSVVSQRPHLFAGTIRDNLLLAKPEASAADVAKACDDAALTRSLALLPDGLDTVVGDRGTRLSGGEQQRVAIAQALLRDAPVLVLDEITSQLDAQTEREVADALRAVRRGRTVVLIAHRLSTIMDADEIVVLDNGTVVERGFHAQLVAGDGAYARLVNTPRRTAA